MGVTGSSPKYAHDCDGCGASLEQPTIFSGKPRIPMFCAKCSLCEMCAAETHPERVRAVRIIREVFEYGSTNGLIIDFERLCRLILE